MISEKLPEWVEWENVSDAVGKKHRADFDSFIQALEELGYGGFWTILNANHVGAPHVRPRVWLVGRLGWHSGFREALHNLPLNKTSWPTPRVGGRGTYVFKRKAGKKIRTRDDLETTLFIQHIIETTGKSREEVENMPPNEARAILGDLKMNADWMENLQGFPIGHTNPNCKKPRIPVDSKGNYIFPSQRGEPQRASEPPRLIPLRNRSKEAKLNSERARGIGDSWSPIQAAQAYKFLYSLFSTHA